MNKKGMEMGFGWIFGIIAGAVILFIAIYATTNLIGNYRLQQDTESAAQLGILLNPIETNLEESKYAVIKFPVETRVINGCRETGPFGRQIIKISTKSGIGEEWGEGGLSLIFFNKYLFSKNTEQGEKLHVFVKPLELPYKVADLVFASFDDYCFVNPPNDIEEEISSINPGNINISFDVASCPSGSEIVCFSSSGCDIDVNVLRQSVEKNGEVVYYHGPLVYGAIFAEPELYECQVKRLLKRDAEIAQLYASKAEFLSVRGCSSNLAEDLQQFSFALGSVENSQDFLNIIIPAAEAIGDRNDKLICKLF